MQTSTLRCAAVDDGQAQDSRGASPPAAGILVTAAKRTASEAVPSVEATTDCSGKRGKSACCIPGCTSDPKNFKAYNLRYHVCEAHLKVRQRALPLLQAYCSEAHAPHRPRAHQPQRLVERL